MKKSPFLVKTNLPTNHASQSVPNKKLQAAQPLNYLQIIKQYNSCKLIKTEASSVQPISRITPTKENPTVSPLLAQANFRSKLNMNATSSKNLTKPNINLQNNFIEEKATSPSSTYAPKLLNKYVVKVPFDSYLRKSKESEDNKQPIITNASDKTEKENIYYADNKIQSKRNSKLPSNGSQRGSIHKENKEKNCQLSPRDASKDSLSYFCVYHPDKKVDIFFNCFLNK